MTTYFGMSKEEKLLVDSLIGENDGLRIRLLEAIELSGDSQAISLKYLVCDYWEWDMLINFRILANKDERYWRLNV